MPHLSDSTTQDNILKQYRSYAYHHLLIVCDSTTTALELQGRGTENVTELQRTRSHQLNKDKKYEGQSLTGGKGSNYVVLIDGFVDSEFYITKADWTTIISPNKNGQQSMAQVDGKMEIVEPYGAIFMERLVDVCDELLTDPTGLVFVLKTYFVGYNDDFHRHQVETFTNTKPFLFNLVDITAVIDETGSNYSLEMIGISNGYGKLKHVSNIAKGFSMQIDRGVTIAATLAGLEEALNVEYDDFANAQGIDFDAADPDANKPNGGLFRPVRYKILIGDDYIDGKYLAGTNELDRNSDGPNTVTIQFSKEQNIEGIIKKIMESSKAVTDEASRKEGKSIFKINSFLRSTPTELVVEYQVNRFTVATTTVEKLKAKELPDIGDNPNIRVYDYIFTGNNTDIINFDIKMDMGLSFLHLAAGTSFPDGQIADKDGGTSSVQTNGSSGITASKTQRIRSKTPLFLGDKLTNPKVRNKQNVDSVANFNALLARHAALENIAVTMKIHGDPSLMSEMLVTDVTDAINAETKETFMTAPALVKVNIKMPDHGTNPTSFRSFWYDGLYMLHSVETSFDAGEFTQELTMFSIPVTSKQEETTEKETDKVKGGSKVDTGNKKTETSDAGDAGNQPVKDTL